MRDARAKHVSGDGKPLRPRRQDGTRHRRQPWIGYQIARGLLETGARVYISARSSESCASAAADLSRYGTAPPCPLTSPLLRAQGAGRCAWSSGAGPERARQQRRHYLGR